MAKQMYPFFDDRRPNGPDSGIVGKLMKLGVAPGKPEELQATSLQTCTTSDQGPAGYGRDRARLPIPNNKTWGPFYEKAAALYQPLGVTNHNRAGDTCPKY